MWLEINLGAPPSPAPQATGLAGAGAMLHRHGKNSLMVSTAGCLAARFCRKRRLGVHPTNDITTRTRVAGRVVLSCFCTGVIHTYGFAGIVAYSPQLRIFEQLRIPLPAYSCRSLAWPRLAAGFLLQLQSGADFLSRFCVSPSMDGPVCLST